MEAPAGEEPGPAARRGDYVNSIADTSVVFISHEPKFLNRACTDIMAYVEKKLGYTPGDFR